jgi:ribosomal protein S14
VGATEALVGTAGAVGAAKNTGAIIHAMSGKRQGDFKPSTREGAIQNNAEKNRGTNKCERCGQSLVRTQNKKGKRHPKTNYTFIMIPRSKTAVERILKLR